MPIPAIACIGVIGRHDNPLHIALFPPHLDAPGAYVEFSFLLNSTLDVFDLRTRQRSNTSVDQDLGMLHAVDERLSCWGWETCTGIRFCIIIDMFGREGGDDQMLGLRDGELKPAFKALHTAYIRLLQNPFYNPDEHTPMAVAGGQGTGGEIRSPRFIAEVKRIGDLWAPGIMKI